MHAFYYWIENVPGKIYIFIFSPINSIFTCEGWLQKILYKIFKFHTLKHVLYAELVFLFFFNSLKCKFAWLELQHFDFLLLIFILSINCLVFYSQTFYYVVYKNVQTVDIPFFLRIENKYNRFKLTTLNVFFYDTKNFFFLLCWYPILSQLLGLFYVAKYVAVKNQYN